MDRKARLRQVPEEIFNKGNLELVGELFTDDYVLHDPNFPGEVRGIDGFKSYVSAFRTGMPDLEITVEDQVAEGSKVVTRWRGSGTHDGELMGVPATGKRVETSGMIISRFEDDKIAEEWASVDVLGLMTQIGAVSGP
jgi:steroid delta-isomerase-like uncharacterized protein